MIHRYFHHEDPMPTLKRPLPMFRPRLGVARREREAQRRSRLGLQGWLTRIFVAAVAWLFLASAALNFLQQWSDAGWFRAGAMSAFIAGMTAMVTGAVLMLIRDDRR